MALQVANGTVRNDGGFSLQGKPSHNAEVMRISDRYRFAFPTAVKGFSRQQTLVYAQASIAHPTNAEA